MKNSGSKKKMLIFGLLLFAVITTTGCTAPTNGDGSRVLYMHWATS